MKMLTVENFVSKYSKEAAIAYNDYNVVSVTQSPKQIVIKLKGDKTPVQLTIQPNDGAGMVRVLAEEVFTGNSYVYHDVEADPEVVHIEANDAVIMCNNNKRVLTKTQCDVVNWVACSNNSSLYVTMHGTSVWPGILYIGTDGLDFYIRCDWGICKIPKCDLSYFALGYVSPTISNIISGMAKYTKRYIPQLANKWDCPKFGIYQYKAAIPGVITELDTKVCNVIKPGTITELLPQKEIVITLDDHCAVFRVEPEEAQRFLQSTTIIFRSIDAKDITFDTGAFMGTAGSVDVNDAAPMKNLSNTNVIPVLEHIENVPMFCNRRPDAVSVTFASHNPFVRFYFTLGIRKVTVKYPFDYNLSTKVRIWVSTLLTKDTIVKYIDKPLKALTSFPRRDIYIPLYEEQFTLHEMQPDDNSQYKLAVVVNDMSIGTVYYDKYPMVSFSHFVADEDQNYGINIRNSIIYDDGLAYLHGQLMSGLRHYTYVENCKPKNHNRPNRNTVVQIKGLTDFIRR